MFWCATWSNNFNALRCSALGFLAAATTAACHLLHIVSDEDVGVESSNDVDEGSEQLFLARKGFHLCLRAASAMN